MMDQITKSFCLQKKYSYGLGILYTTTQWSQTFMMFKFPSNLLPKFGLISWKILEILKTHIANVLKNFGFIFLMFQQVQICILIIHFIKPKCDNWCHWIYAFMYCKKNELCTKKIWFSERNSALPWCTKCKTKALFSPIIPLYCIATVWIEQLKCGQKLLAIQQLFSENLCLKPCPNKIKIETIAWMISYSKCSICRCLSKLSSNFGWLFTFCYLDKATLRGRSQTTFTRGWG